MSSRYENYVNINISDDEMGADIFLADPPTPDFYNIDELEEFLTDEGIVFGVSKFILTDIIRNKRYSEFIRFADGIRPGKAEDGHYEFKFNQNPSKKPKLNPDGSVDYYNLNLVEVTEKDQLLAEYIPRKDGSDGRTVMGGFIPGTKAHDLPVLRGKGFYMSEDKKQYFAEYSGKVELVMGHLTISNMHTITGDVDLSTGHIDFKGDLLITGNIKSDMRVRASGNITVDGLIESASVEAGKSVLVKGGILGGGKAVIKGGEDVFALFIESAFVEAGACVQADSIVNCTINAYSDVNVYGKTSCIIGGSLKANRYIMTKVIGSKKGVTTALEVGVTNDCRAERKRYAEELDANEQELGKIEKLLEKLMKTGEEMTEMFISATRKKINLSADLYRTKAIIKELDARLAMGRDAQIVAEKRVFPGSRLMIDGIRYDVADEFEEIMFFRKQDKIVSKRYEHETDSR